SYAFAFHSSTRFQLSREILEAVIPRDVTTMPVGRKAQPFDHPDWLFELKYDGFRALAFVQCGRCSLLSRNGHAFASFADLATRIENALMPRTVVLDGEI